MTARTATPLVPASALRAWDRLCEALDGYTPGCASRPDEWFDGDLEAAAEACGYCPAQAECLAFATAASERFGIWGGRQFPVTEGVS